ncbi:hypothetical protein GQ53DRAFT_827974 [Thozetella sp. PMI_491]|nr:hypothetical protein GQ53DRAFT_827974 [Thozetella sp. PMI_491]
MYQDLGTENGKESLCYHQQLAGKGLQDHGYTQDTETRIVPNHSFMSFQQTRSILASALVSAFLVILITIYSTDSAPLDNTFGFAFETSSKTIFVLSIMSGANGIFLATTVAGVFERLRWLLLAQPGGTTFLRTLSLDPGTGMVGLLRLGFGWSLPLLSTTRASSVIRMASLALTPILGVLIMSNVNTKMHFSRSAAAQPVLGWGMKPFNASLAAYMGIVSNQLVNGLVLENTAYAIDITDPADLTIACGSGPLNPIDTRCRRTYVLPGGIDNAVRQLNSTAPLSDYLLAENQQCLVLDFVEGEPSWIFEDNECGTYGFPFSAFTMCLRNETESSLQSRILGCPPDVSTKSGCLSNTTWNRDLGWQVTLNLSFVNASVAYSRRNGSILSYQPTGPPEPAKAPGRDMIDGLHAAFGNFTDGLESLIPMLSQPEKLLLFPLYAYPVYIWGFLQGAKSLASSDPEFVARGHDTLASILSLIMYFGQPSVYAQAMMTTSLTQQSSAANASEIQALSAELAITTPPDVPIYTADLQYRIVVGRATLIVYVVLSGLTLSICLFLLMHTAMMPGTSRVPSTTSYPTWNTAVHCEFKAEDSATEMRCLGSLPNREMIQAARTLRVGLTCAVDDQEEHGAQDFKKPL